MNNLKKAMSLTLCGVLAAGALSGCSGNKGKDAKSGSPVTLNGDAVYPVKCDDTISYWMGLNPLIAQDYTNFAETPLGQELEKRTGIKVEYVHGQTGQENEQFNILLASGELPDMTQYNWDTYPGGPDRAIKEECIIPLQNVMDYMPALKKIFESDKDIEKKVKTDSGNYYTAPLIREKDWMSCYQGLILRNDWMKECGLEEPKTIDQFENILKTFKSKYNVAPLAMADQQVSFLMYAFGTAPDFYIDGSEVKYGYAQPEYKRTLELMNKWYKEELLDKDYAVLQVTDLNNRVLTNKTGAIFGAAGGGIEEMLNARGESMKNLELTSAQPLRLQEEEVPEYGFNADPVMTSIGTAISASCKNFELAARYLDYGYTDEGFMLYNFGIEGVTYNMVDGKPVMSDFATHNPDGLTYGQVTTRYCRSPYNGPFVQAEEYVKQGFTYKEQGDAYERWGNNNMVKHLMPTIYFKDDEIDKAADIQTALNTYVEESRIKFVTGEESLDNFDAYVEQLNNLGLTELLNMEKSAYDRFNNR